MKTAVIAITALLATTSQGIAMDSLDKHGWQNRVLVLFGSDGDKKLADQVRLLKGRTAELADRDMVVLQVSGGTVSSVYGDASGVDARRLKSEAGVSGDGFQAVLIGKDGGVKLRSSQVVSDVEMFDLIDRMPMRRAGKS